MLRGGFFFFLGIIVFSQALKAYTIEDIRRWTRSPKATTVDGFLSILPARLRASYTLIHFSRSIQGAEFKSPRVILYDPLDARLMMSFTDSDQRGSEGVESILFNSITHQFEFSVVRFEEGKKPTLDTQPMTCNGCHASRPVWDDSNLLPGFYGSLKDEAFAHHFNPQAPLSDLVSATESENLENFLVGASKRDRYRNLLPLKNPAPTVTLGKHLQKLNYSRIAQALMLEPDLLPQILSDLMLCQENPNEELELKDLADLIFTSKAYRENARYTFSYLPSPFDRDRSADRQEFVSARVPLRISSDMAMARLRKTHAKTYHSLSLQDWSMELFRTHYSFENGAGGVLDLLPFLEMMNHRTIAKLRPYWPTPSAIMKSGNKATEKACKILRAEIKPLGP
jgi:hypothetical protein